MFILTIISPISFQRTANGFRNLSEKHRRMMFFDFQGQKVLLKAELEGTPGLLAQAGIIFLDSRARRELFEYLWVRHGLRMTKL